jgi:hypothetical protein
MKKNTVKSAKDKIKDKLAQTKAKVKGKLKGTAAAIACLLLFAGGCMDTAPASRYTATTVGDIVVKNNVDDLRSRSGRAGTNGVETAAAKAPLVSISTMVQLSDVTMASADSKGSTETQTATPTLDVRTRVDARYNDAISGATAASKTVLGQIADGATSVLDMMLSKKSGTVKVTKTDGTEATVECKDGQCSFVDSTCTDGSCSPGGAK